MRSRMLWGGLLLLLVLPLVSAVSPQNWTDVESVAENETLAFDNNSVTATLIQGGAGNVTYFNFTALDDGAAIVSVSAFFLLNTSGFVDDQWGLFWRNETTWNVLESLNATNSGNSSRNFSIGANRWTYALLENIELRLEVMTTGGLDSYLMSLQEVFLALVLDVTGPAISLSGPANDTFATTAFQQIQYSATDISNVTNCSLFVNDVLNQTRLDVVDSQGYDFPINFSDGVHEWIIECTDNSTQFFTNVSQRRTITVDLLPPQIALLSPANASNYTAGNPVDFSYNFTEATGNATCELYLNNTLNQSRFSWANEEQNFLVYLDTGDYSWFVSCSDSINRTANSSTRVVSVQSNEAPVISSFTLTQNVSPVLGANVTVSCAAEATDASSGEIASARARLYREGYTGIDDVSSQYTNTTCALLPLNATSRSVACDFQVGAQARAGSWLCSLNVTDVGGETRSAVNSTFVEPLYAFSIAPAEIDYGVFVEAGQTSSDVSLVLTNVGNAFIDFTLDGYGVSDGDGLAMVCGVGNVSLADHRYSLSAGSPFAAMTSLSDEPVLVDVDLSPGNETFTSTDSLFWKARLPVPANGSCGGFVTITAIPT